MHRKCMHSCFKTNAKSSKTFIKNRRECCAITTSTKMHSSAYLVVLSHILIETEHCIWFEQKNPFHSWQLTNLGLRLVLHWIALYEKSTKVNNFKCLNVLFSFLRLYVLIFLITKIKFHFTWRVEVFCMKACYSHFARIR